MKFIFEDEAFKFETLRAAGFAGDAGADIGEVIVTTSRIPEGDEDAWTAAWKATADRIAKTGEVSLKAGDPVSAREAFFRASSYYRSAEFYRRKDPLNDPQVLELSRLSADYLVKAGDLLDGPFREVAIPYEGREIPGYLFLVDDSGQPRPTVIYTNGFDSTREEGYFVIGAAALRRGYNFLAYDGPGQGWMIREKNVPYRPDWENVLGPVVDYAETVPEIDNDRIVHFGYSLGGYLVARYAAYDHRSAAIVCNDGMTTFYASYPPIPADTLQLIEEKRDEEAMSLLEEMIKNDTNARWGLQNGVWVNGVANFAEYVRSTADYTLTDNDIHKIQTPVLLLEGEDDKVFAGQATKVASELSAPHEHVVMRSADGAGAHCHEGAMFLLHQTIFNWLAKTLN
ncbi:alpha/beta hydrolase family protein [Streptomyces malaysiensis]|uniref:alpha/beta hydrolase family protein n=1 Tax=Streptomyces malaysiensis TaxID=92644 RepID=UPI0020449C3C|nr:MULTISPECIES: alpha/beta fold hydrolase [unclassified Streptomyces]MCM3812792.1 alpha/beta fold hydrolase [Streptomyces sp. DR7-3]WHX15559.1 alpha/beta fold hydrolase [Streptomyces sp. NA07423]